jgi:hypothetical protein
MPPVHEMSAGQVILGRMTAQGSLGDWRLAGIRTAAELRAAGRSAAEIEALVRRGTLIQIRRGVYARAALADRLRTRSNGEHLLRAAAALATFGPGAVASHQTAASLYAMDLLGRSGEDVTLTRAPGHNRSGRPGVHVYSADLPAGHVTEMHGMPVTTPARTIVDLARSLEFRAGVVAADSALHLKLASPTALESVLADCSGWRGTKRAAEVIAFADGLSESVLESLARVVFRDCGLPPPELQVWVGGAEVVGRVDFLWRRFRTVVEVDGRMKYATGVRAVRQLERDQQLRDAGYEVVHFTWQQINENPGYVNATIRKAFRRGLQAKPHPAA